MSRCRWPGDYIRADGLISGPDVTTYFDQIDTGVPQCVDETPKTGVIHSHRVQDRAGRLYRLDLAKILQQLERYRARDSNFVRRLSHLRLGLVAQRTEPTMPATRVPGFTRSG
jgi:hypothetical protein